MADQRISTLTCPECEREMQHEKTAIQESGVAQVDTYRCSRCQRTAAVIHNKPVGAVMREETETWVESEIRRQGFWFPKDY